MKRTTLSLLLLFLLATAVILFTSCDTGVCRHAKSDISHHTRVEPTCTDTGNIEYWSCAACGKCFSDSKLTAEIVEDKTVLPIKHEFDSYDYCPLCDYQKGSDGIEYTKINGGYAVAEVSTAASEVVIANKVNGEPVLQIGKNAFFGCDNMTSVKIPSTVISIESHAFSGCANLSSIDIPSSITSIGSRAFSNCSSLTSITIPDNVTSIGYMAFSECASLEDVYLGAGITQTANDAFLYCPNIKSITVNEDNTVYHSVDNCLIETATKTLIVGCKNSIIPTDGSVTVIGKDSFKGCPNVADLVIPEGITEIDDYAFHMCSDITRLALPDSITRIGKAAFSDCTNLTSVIIPESTKSIDTDAFDGCYKLVEVINKSSLQIRVGSYNHGYVGFNALVVHKESSKISNKDGYLFYTHNGINYLLGYTGTDVELTLPSDFNGAEYEIYQYAFANRSDLESITIPDGVTGIGYRSFIYCTELQRITVPDSVTSIGTQAFSYCNSLTDVAIGNSLTNVSTGIFEYSNNISTITVSDQNPKYHSNGNCLIETDTKTLVMGCKNSIIPNDGSVTTINYHAFYGCKGLTEITIGDSVTDIRENAFYGCTGLTSVVIGNDVTSIGNSAFFGCTALKSVSIGKNVTSIGKTAFYGCTALTSITIPNSVKSIGNDAFKGCYKLVEVINNSTLRFLPGDETYGLLGYYAIIVHNGSSKIVNKDGYLFCSFNDVNYLFGYSGTDTELSLPSDYNGEGYEIRSYAFYNCTSISGITVPKCVTSIGDYAFKGCTGLLNVIIENGTTSIGNCAFYECENLESIIIPDSVTSIGNSAFYGCQELKSVNIPNGLESISMGMFSSCYSLESISLPDSITNISHEAFNGCSSLVKITIPKDVTYIGSYAFYGCTSLSCVTLESTEGWVADNEELESESLADASEAANYLTKKYSTDSWSRS